MTFKSILFQHGSPLSPAEQRHSPPDFFVDLALDQIVAALSAGKEEYRLSPFYFTPLQDIDDIAFRHEIMRDLERLDLFDGIREFAENMRSVRKRLGKADQFSDWRQKTRWFLDAVDNFCETVVRLLHALDLAPPASRGLSAFREVLAGYAASDRFTALCHQTDKLKNELASIRYCVRINGLVVQVRRYAGEADYSAEIKETFERFEHGADKEYPFESNDIEEMNHVQLRILDQVVKLYPEVFSELKSYHEAHQDFQDGAIVSFDREIQFYVAYLEHIAPMKAAGLRFCYPRIVRDVKEVYGRQSFDLALAGKLLGVPTIPVCNDFHLKGRERILVVSGPNQGGKTTFARAFGQLHYLAALGCPVPGTEAQLYLFDRMFTHFEKEETIVNLRGKLQDDLVRIHAILQGATPRSLVVINEIFASTTFRDARALSRKIASRLFELDLLCVWVTFVDELASLGEQTVSMMSTVVPDNPAQRTYKIVRRPADGLAYAVSIAERHRLTYDRIRERLEP
ncbi:MAG TPA: hypothetical protein VJ955_08240 [Desulfuromonadales bacterium]|nr:hypothetical protein [Desulfuromonadales bacterium]